MKFVKSENRADCLLAVDRHVAEGAPMVLNRRQLLLLLGLLAVATKHGNEAVGSLARLVLRLNAKLVELDLLKDGATLLLNTFSAPSHAFTITITFSHLH